MRVIKTNSHSGTAIKMKQAVEVKCRSYPYSEQIIKVKAASESRTDEGVTFLPRFIVEIILGTFRRLGSGAKY